MNPRWNGAARTSHSIHCAVIEVPTMSDNDGEDRAHGFRDLVPWADPYIAALIDKLRRSADCDEVEFVGELPPPLDSQDADADDDWTGQWSPRNWPLD